MPAAIIEGGDDDAGLWIVEGFADRTHDLGLNRGLIAENDEGPLPLGIGGVDFCGTKSGAHGA